jgi:cytochrome c55X
MSGPYLFLDKMTRKQVRSITGIMILLASMATQAEFDVEQQSRIRHMVLHDCGSCHGMTLKGGLGPALTAEKLQYKSHELLSTIIMNGVEGTPMPPWKGILDEQEVAWMVKQLKDGALESH